MSSTTVRRIHKELGDLLTEPLDNIQIIPDEGKIHVWEVVMQGPPGTAYSKGKFLLSVEFGQEFPFKAPTVKFKTKTYHPNIDSDGNICIGLLKTEQWKPSTKMTTVLLSIYDLLEHPNPDDPLVTSIAEQYRNDPRGFEKKATDYTAKYAL